MATEKIQMKMARATEADMDAANRLANLLGEVDKGYYPSAPAADEKADEPLWFNPDDPEQLRDFYDRVMAHVKAAPGGLFRVTFGFSTLMHNNVCDPALDVLELHPDLVAAREAAKRAYPQEITPELRDVLGMMNFETCPIAHGFRDAGASIPRKVEEEQAYVLHWLIGHVLTAGPDWRKAAAIDLKAAADAIKAKAMGGDK
jgi:hypothetical protein